MAELMESFCCLITSIVNFRRLSCSWLCDITLTACDRVKERGKDGNLSAGHGWRWTPVKAGDEKRERESGEEARAFYARIYDEAPNSHLFQISARSESDLMRARFKTSQKDSCVSNLNNPVAIMRLR